MNINETQIVNNNHQNIQQNKKIKQREMELETEIPIWFNGRVKWISNLSCRSKCSDVIEAILSSIDSNFNSNENYILYESWRGVERPLKSRCRLLKLWKSWGGESENVILTLRSRKQENISTKFLIKKNKKLKSKFNNNNDKMLTYLNISRSIIRLNNQINNQEKLIFHLTNKIENENKEENYFNENDFKEILSDVNQTLIYSRKLTILSDQFDQQINQINDQIENKQIILDQLELDLALQENIHIDNIDFKFDSPSPSPTITPIKTLSVSNRPTAIVEPNLSKIKTSPLSLKKLNLQDKQLTKTKIKFIPFSISELLNNNHQSDNVHSNQEQLITLV